MITFFLRRTAGACKIVIKRQSKSMLLMKSFHKSANRILPIHKPVLSQSAKYRNCVIFGLQQRHFSETNPTTSTTDDDIFNHNKQRSENHRQEIIQNQEPKVSHPNANTMKPPTDDDDDTTKYYVDKSRPKFEDYVLPHTIWSKEKLEQITPTHKKPVRTADKLALASTKFMRFVWDLSTGYTLGRQLGLFKFTPNMWLLRIVFLETVAGVPGMMFGMARHLHSLRRMERDRGWIKMLLAEAENERMHLLTVINLYKPSKMMRYLIVIAQGIMCNTLFAAYLISPRFCHSWVGYIEEQAVHTYTTLLKDIDDGKYPEFEQNASELAKAYWILPEDATWRDVFANIRADESHHRDVNHDLAELTDDPKAMNPYRSLQRNDWDKDLKKWH